MSGKKLKTIETTIENIKDLPFLNKHEIRGIYGSQFTFLYLENDKYVPTLIERINDSIKIEPVQIIAPITDKFESYSYDTFHHFMLFGFEYQSKINIYNSKVVRDDLFTITSEIEQKSILIRNNSFIKPSEYDLIRGDTYFISARFGKNIFHYPTHGTGEYLFHNLEKTDPNDTDGIILLASNLNEKQIQERIDFYTRNFKNEIKEERIKIIKND